MKRPLHRFRPATLADADTVAAMARSFHAEDGHPLSDRGMTAVMAMLDPGFDQGAIILLEVEGEIAGYGMLSFGWGIEYGGRETFVEDIFVRPQFRSKGYGALLLEALEAHARLAGCKAVRLEVMPRNPAERLYRRAGYGDRGSLLMTKVL